MNRKKRYETVINEAKRIEKELFDEIDLHYLSRIISHELLDSKYFKKDEFYIYIGLSDGAIINEKTFHDKIDNILDEKEIQNSEKSKKELLLHKIVDKLLELVDKNE